MVGDKDVLEVEVQLIMCSASFVLEMERYCEVGAAPQQAAQMINSAESKARCSMHVLILAKWCELRRATTSSQA